MKKTNVVIILIMLNIVMCICCNTDNINASTLYNSPNQVDFGINFVNKLQNDVTITNAVITGVDAGDFTITSGWTGSPIIVQSNQTNLFTIEFNPTNTGNKNATLEIEHNETTVASPIYVTLQGESVIDATVSLTPDNYEFGLVLNGNSEIQQFDIRNDGLVSVDILNIDKIGGNPSNFEILGWTGPVLLDAGNSIQIDVRFTQTGWTDKQTTLQVTHNGSNSPVNVPLSGGDYIQKNFSLGITSIRTTGTDIVAPASGHFDDESYNINIGFTFEYYGNSYSNVNVCDNGFASFTSTSTEYENITIPQSPEPNEALYVFWDDVEFAPTIYSDVKFVYQVDGSAPDRILTIEWYHFNRYYATPPPSPAKVTYQVKLYETTNIIEFLYSSLIADWTDTNWTATIGLENINGTYAIEKTNSPNINVRPTSNYRFVP